MCTKHQQQLWKCPAIPIQKIMSLANKMCTLHKTSFYCQRNSSLATWLIICSALQPEVQVEQGRTPFFFNLPVFPQLSQTIILSLPVTANQLHLQSRSSGSATFGWLRLRNSLTSLFESTGQFHTLLTGDPGLLHGPWFTEWLHTAPLINWHATLQYVALSKQRLTMKSEIQWSGI